MQTGSEAQDCKENQEISLDKFDLKIMQNLASTFPQMFLGPLGVGGQAQNQNQQNASQNSQNAGSPQEQQQNLDLQQLMMATLEGMNSNPQNLLQNLNLQQLMGLSGLPKSETPQESQTSTTPNAETGGGDEMANFMASLIASTTAPSTTTTSAGGAPNPASLLDQLNLMQNLFGGNVPATTGANSSINHVFTSTPSAISQGNTNSGVSTPMTPSHAQNGLPSANLLNSPLAGLQAGFNSPNKDSYCELCDKNFCNRYFLRTHKQKKHGIGMPPSEDGSIERGSPSKMPGLPFQLQMQNSGSPKSAQPASVIVNGSSGSADEPTSPLAKMPKLAFPSMASLDRRGSAEPSLDSILELNASPTSLLAQLANKAKESSHNADSNALMSIMESLNQTPTKAAEDRSICELCDKEFESKHHLLQHQIFQHGTSSALNTTTPSQAQVQAHAQAQAQAQAAAQANALLSILPGGMLPPLPFLLPQGLQGLPTLPPGFPSLSDLDPAAAAFMLNGQSPGGPMGGPNKNMPQKRQYSSTSKNFCDLCNKEVCNKYFLRTHMLKMHNIVIDENKTVIASIDTTEKEKQGALSFRCDICHQEMKTRQQLRDHKKTSHGVMPLMTPPGNRGGSVKPGSGLNSASSSAGSNSTGTAFGFTNKDVMEMQMDQQGQESAEDMKINQCPMCQKTLTGNDLVDHLKSEHSKDMPPELMAEIEKMLLPPSREQPQNPETVPSSASSISGLSTASTSNSNMNKCRFCPETFSSEFEIQMHYMTSHENELKSQLVQVLGAGGDPEEAIDEDAAMQATTQVALQMAQANQLQKQQKVMKPFACDICRRRYRNEVALSRHVNSVHKWSKILSPKKKQIKSFISPTKISKLIHSFACIKCQKRFISRDECRRHIIQHLKAEKLAQVEAMSDSVASSSDATKALSEKSTTILPDPEVKDMETEDFDEELLSSYICENSGTTLTQERSSVVDQVVSEIHEELSRRNSHKEEKHSHTSGSVSPLSVQMPEGYAQPAQDQKKPFSVQSFLMRELCENGLKGQFLNELIAYLPVRTTITEPIQVTFELRPTPHIDAQVQHL